MANGLIGATQRNAIHVTRIFKAERRLFEKSNFIKYTDGENDPKIEKKKVLNPLQKGNVSNQITAWILVHWRSVETRTNIFRQVEHWEIRGIIKIEG